MTIEDFHTYFVSDIGIWVHNSQCETARVWDLYGTGDAISKKNLNNIVDSMKKNGWVGDPIEVYEANGKLLIVDGHHRAKAAKMAGIENVPIKRLTMAELAAKGMTEEQLLNGFYYG